MRPVEHSENLPLPKPPYQEMQSSNSAYDHSSGECVDPNDPESENKPISFSQEALNDFDVVVVVVSAAAAVVQMQPSMVSYKTNLKDLVNTIGLKINEKKAYTLFKNITDADLVTLNDKPIANVDEFNYQGTKITTDGNCIHEINTKINKANQSFVGVLFNYRESWTQQEDTERSSKLSPR
ncbi:Hypothetical predicted protein [Octopus vulgaris]|uniref:Uncharacterized protein n=1 Tax=Octopus vulgaris TaxID=6645 RepID=A0AA36F1U4_OCTVU|nr:Hypothetical predicted protein [Octopus vulgaris]